MDINWHAHCTGRVSSNNPSTTHELAIVTTTGRDVVVEVTAWWRIPDVYGINSAPEEIDIEVTRARYDDGESDWSAEALAHAAPDADRIRERVWEELNMAAHVEAAASLEGE